MPATASTGPADEPTGVPAASAQPRARPAAGAPARRDGRIRRAPSPTPSSSSDDRVGRGQRVERLAQPAARQRHGPLEVLARDDHQDVGVALQSKC